MKSKSVVLNGVLIVMLALTSVATRAQITDPDTGGGGGTLPTTRKSCPYQVSTTDPNGAPMTCTITIVITAAGECVEGEARYLISPSATCQPSGEMCSTPSVYRCGSSTASFNFGCGGQIFTVGPAGTTGDWGQAMTPTGTCADIGVSD